MILDASQIKATRDRYEARTKQRERNLALIRKGALLAIDDPDRITRFLRHHGFDEVEITHFLKESEPSSPGDNSYRAELALERAMGTNDLMGVNFLERGLQVARTVGRIVVGGATDVVFDYGTGFLVSPSLLMTNNHVLRDEVRARSSLVEFDYKLGVDKRVAESAAFQLEPDRFFLTSKRLDYTVVAVAPLSTSQRPLASFGWNKLLGQEGKAIIGLWLNIIQHPKGEHLQLCLRENQLIDLFDDFLHYRTDTDRGSSGSPVFNDRWEVVGLHRSGVWRTDGNGKIMAVDGQIWTEEMGEHRIDWIANEGVRISRIMADLREQENALDEEQRALLTQMLDGPPPTARAQEMAGTTVDGGISVTVPVTFTVRLANPGSPIALLPPTVEISPRSYDAP